MVSDPQTPILLPDPPCTTGWVLPDPRAPKDESPLMTTEPPTVPRFYTATDPQNQTRRCNRCRRWLPLKWFYHSVGRPMDRDYTCAPCRQDEHEEERKAEGSSPRAPYRNTIVSAIREEMAKGDDPS